MQRPFVQTFNAFLPPGEQVVEGRSTARLHLRIPALKLTMKDVQVCKTISAQKHYIHRRLTLHDFLPVWQQILRKNISYIDV
jgi:hypothetical protein